MKRRGLGDGGRTSLADGTRLSKSDARIGALGAVDELGAALGLVRAAAQDQPLQEMIAGLQRDLLALATQIARPTPSAPSSDDKAHWSASRVEQLEARIDAAAARLPPLRSLVLSGGCATAAALQWARAVCRRAEAATVMLAEHETLEPSLLAYLNRLSDLLFVLAREENQRRGLADEEW